MTMFQQYKKTLKLVEYAFSFDDPQERVGLATAVYQALVGQAPTESNILADRDKYKSLLDEVRAERDQLKKQIEKLKETNKALEGDAFEYRRLGNLVDGYVEDRATLSNLAKEATKKLDEYRDALSDLRGRLEKVRRR